jgi:ribonuclease P protein component
MTNGSQATCAAAVIASDGNSSALRDNSVMRDESSDQRDARLRKHADYQRVYKESRKHFSASMSYFFRRRGDQAPDAGVTHEAARVGLTAGKVLGKAVERNRIKRRMREAVRMNLSRLPQSVDVVLHPRKFVIDMDFGKLTAEVGRVFSTVSAQVEGGAAASRHPAGRKPGTRR